MISDLLNATQASCEDSLQPCTQGPSAKVRVQSLKDFGGLAQDPRDINPDGLASAVAPIVAANAATALEGQSVVMRVLRQFAGNLDLIAWTQASQQASSRGIVGQQVVGRQTAFIETLPDSIGILRCTAGPGTAPVAQLAINAAGGISAPDDAQVGHIEMVVPVFARNQIPPGRGVVATDHKALDQIIELRFDGVFDTGCAEDERADFRSPSPVMSMQLASHRQAGWHCRSAQPGLCRAAPSRSEDQAAAAAAALTLRRRIATPIADRPAIMNMISWGSGTGAAKVTSP